MSLTDGKLWFGKYNGENLRDIPVDYLIWLEEQKVGPALRNALNGEIARRRGDRPGIGRSVPRGTAGHKPGQGSLF